MTDSSPYTQELETLFRAVRKQYTAIKEKAHSYVVRWEWTNGRRYELRPLYFERSHERS